MRTPKWLYAAVALVVWIGLTAAPPLAAAQAKEHPTAQAQKAEHPTKAKAEKKLYDRLGKKKGITAVVKDFLGNVGADTRINKFFAHTDLKKLELNLVNQICEASGGPCKYTGRDMKTAHKGMGIRTADFNALVDDLVRALDKNKVGEKEKGELLAVLGPMKSDIVEKP